MTIQEYIKNLNQHFITGNATEHTYRGYLQALLADINRNIVVTSEPARIDCGAPDYIITQNNITVGYIEAKDIGANLSDKKYKEQFDRYKHSLDNIIITDFISFELFKNGKFIRSVDIGEVQGNKIVAKPENLDAFINLIKNFCDNEPQTIKTSKKLAQMMAGKARILTAIIEKAIKNDEQNNVESDIRSQMQAFAENLTTEIKPEEFADIYSQTIAYSMFAARLHDESQGNFSRHETANHIPKSNPFLHRLFQQIAGYDLDKRIDWVIDALADVFEATDTNAILKEFDKLNQDPVIHFYENFLGEYNPLLRKKRGVYYTPPAVVKFIVNAVDDILKNEFNIPGGCADTSKTNIKVSENGQVFEKQVHKVQIIDPAAGTGTFLAEVVSKIYKSFEGQLRNWSGYVDKELIPRLNGFEILMTSYVMTHIKLDLLLNQTGYTPTENEQERLKIFLTNSLVEPRNTGGTSFANWLSQEAIGANNIKNNSPVMVVLGNPPYSGISQNNGKWITNIIEDYKYINGVHFGEKKHWLQDDYVKFIRFGEYFIEENGEGVLAYINNHGYLDGPTFRGMRWHLLNTFDKIFIINLHGNSNKKETCPDGTKDENVFDIQSGVSINIFIKTGRKAKDELAKVYHHDLYGLREEKNGFLLKQNLSSIDFKELNLQAPLYLFAQINYDMQKVYQEGFSVNDLFPVNSVGILTSRDSFTIHKTKDELRQMIQNFLSLDNEEARRVYSLGVDGRDWRVKYAKDDLINSKIEIDKTNEILYRPFDTRFTYYTGNCKGFHSYPRNDVMQHFLLGENVGLITARSNKSKRIDHFYITKNIMETKCGESTTQSAVFPLYTYSKDSKSLLDNELIRKPNLDMKIVNQISDKLGLKFTSENAFFNPPNPLRQEENVNDTFAPIDLLDYIYAILHSPTYRETYKEFLKTDFPRVPYPDNIDKFWKLVEQGGYLRSIHLLENPVVSTPITTYPISGTNHIDKIEYKDGNVWINSKQYFGNVPKPAWEFYIGGYQPTQKWLKDRKSKTLSYEHISHYQKIIVALCETERVMNVIDDLEVG